MEILNGKAAERTPAGLYEDGVSEPSFVEASSGARIEARLVPPWQALVEPSRIFSHPDEVVASADLTREEKRAILASWASDAWAVESAPALRQCPGLVGCYVPLDAVLAALRALDPEDSTTARRELSRPQAGGSGGPSRRIRWMARRTRQGLI